jgi:hypothetical protein
MSTTFELSWNFQDSRKSCFPEEPWSPGCDGESAFCVSRIDANAMMSATMLHLLPDPAELKFYTYAMSHRVMWLSVSILVAVLDCC